MQLTLSPVQERPYEIWIKSYDLTKIEIFSSNFFFTLFPPHSSAPLPKITPFPVLILNDPKNSQINTLGRIILFHSKQVQPEAHIYYSGKELHDKIDLYCKKKFNQDCDYSFSQRSDLSRLCIRGALPYQTFLRDLLVNAKFSGDIKQKLTHPFNTV